MPQPRVRAACYAGGYGRVRDYGGYYAWLRRGASAGSRRDGARSAHIATIHRDSRGTYGVARMHADLADDGERVARKRVARLMRVTAVYRA